MRKFSSKAEQCEKEVEIDEKKETQETTIWKANMEN